jgi:hypothetical protein
VVAVRLLITARDPAAALHLVEVAQAALGDTRFAVTIAAQAPAARYFERAGIAYEPIVLPHLSLADQTELGALLAVARRLVDEVQPDAVLCGLSTPFDAGLDEAVLAVAACPRFLLQDFWGELNLLLGARADHVFAIDDEAARLNRLRFGIDSIVVGSARHSAYAAFDLTGARQRVRRAIGADRDEAVIGFFGQALHRLAGYGRTVQAFLAAFRQLPGPPRLILRSHPRETAEQRMATRAMFADLGAKLAVLDEGSVEDALVACDVVCSLFSNCTFDAAYLNRFSAEPLAVPLSLLFEPEIAAYCRTQVNFEEFPYHRSGLVQPIYEADALQPSLLRALQPATRRDVWRRCGGLPDPALAPRLILDHIFARRHR